MNPFQPRRALDFAKSISRPRLCGGAEERKVAGEVREALRAAGHEIVDEPFEFRPVAETLLRISLFLTQLGLAALVLGAWKDRRLAYAGLAWIALLLPVIPWMIRRAFRATIRPVSGDAPTPRRWIRSTNIVARSSGPADGPLFVFMAHYDSKSQSLSLGGRISLFRFARTAAFGLTGICLARLVGGELATVPVFAVASALVFVLSAPLYLLRTHDHSPGALDNASGVGTLVEMARIWKDLPAAKTSRAWFVAVSGEEFGMTGSQAWVRLHLSELRAEKRLYPLNFDGVGLAAPVRVLPNRGPEAGLKSMTQCVIAAGAAVNVPVGTFPRSIGLMTDHVAFTREKLPCATLLTHSWRNSIIHTAGDAPSVLSEEGFERVGRVAVQLVDDLS